VAPCGLIGQNDYSVHVVGHDNEAVQINAMVMRRQVIPGLLHDRAHFCRGGLKPAPTSPKSMTRFCVQAVMKYAPA
jgi:hypothetical protein